METVAALDGFRPVVAGGFDGTHRERLAFEGAMRASSGVWLGEVSDPGALTALIQGASALVQMSRAEGQALALIEALAVGTPVVTSSLPANRELATRYPGWVHIVQDLRQLPAVVAGLAKPLGPEPVLPTWEDVAGKLLVVYRQACDLS
jgi:glycosyltransferase involved in cell wall biosynthesis